jgi:hypothetical protein
VAVQATLVAVDKKVLEVVAVLAVATVLMELPEGLGLLVMVVPGVLMVAVLQGQGTSLVMYLAFLLEEAAVLMEHPLEVQSVLFGPETHVNSRQLV